MKYFTILFRSVDASKMTKDEDFAAHVQSLMPKEEFKATLNPSQVGKLRKLITELEVCSIVV